MQRACAAASGPRGPGTASASGPIGPRVAAEEADLRAGLATSENEAAKMLVRAVAGVIKASLAESLDRETECALMAVRQTE